MSSSTETQGVLYGASLSIPYAIGSVSIPLAGVSTAWSGVSNEGKSSAWTPATAAEEMRAGTATSFTSASPLSQQQQQHARRRGVSSGNISSVRRCTHHRYCYIRDGGDLTQDAFFRWLHHQEVQLAALPKEAPVSSSSSKKENNSSEAANETVAHAATESQHVATAGDHSAAPSIVPAAHSPSLLYASLECVVFILPNSFPHPRRVARQPPFLIEDDTWAEHMVEVQLHFLPHLQIPPVTVVHQALLERRVLPELPSNAEPSTAETGEVREVWVPQLRASTFGKPKLPSIATNVTLPSTESLADACDPFDSPPSQTAVNTQCSVASQTAIVAEKLDSLRLYHPTLLVLQHVRRVAALSELPALTELRRAFEQLNSVHDGGVSGPAATDTAATLPSPFPFPWSLPYEEVVAEYAAQRAITSVAVLQAVLDGLKRERVALETACERSLQQIADLATRKLPEQLEGVHERCLKLYRKE